MILSVATGHQAYRHTQNKKLTGNAEDFIGRDLLQNQYFQHIGIDYAKGNEHHAGAHIFDQYRRQCSLFRIVFRVKRKEKTTHIIETEEQHLNLYVEIPVQMKQRFYNIDNQCTAYRHECPEQIVSYCFAEYKCYIFFKCIAQIFVAQPDTEKKQNQKIGNRITEKIGSPIVKGPEV